MYSVGDWPETDVMMVCLRHAIEKCEHSILECSRFDFYVEFLLHNIQKIVYLI